jgi:hypothetical protein
VITTLSTEHIMSAFAGSEQKVRYTSTLTFTFTSLLPAGVLAPYDIFSRF